MSVAKQEIDTSLLKRFSPLDELDHDNLAELAAKSALFQFAKGDTVSAKMAKNSMIFLLSGTVDRAPGSEGAETIKAKTDRARRAIFSPSDRARVVAKSDVTVLCIDSQLLDFLRSWGDRAAGKDTGIVVDEIEALMAAIDPVEVGADEVIFHQGDAPDYYYIVSRGRCVVTRRDPGLDALVDLATLGPGTDLITTRAGAKAAISASDSLKNRAESLLRQQMTALSKSLEQEQQTSEALNSENGRLNQQLACIQNKLQLTQQQAEKFQQESQTRETQLGATINQLEESLAEQSDRFQQLHGENQSLQNQHIQLESSYKQLAEEKQSLQDQHVDLDKRFEQLVAANQSLQQQHAERESSFEQLAGEKHSLSSQLDDANQHLERRADLINGLQGELKAAVTRAEPRRLWQHCKPNTQNSKCGLSRANNR